MAKRVAARSHGIEFTDADWERVKEIADRLKVTRSTVINRIIGSYYVAWHTGEWDGLTTHGGRRKGAGRPPKKGGSGKINEKPIDNQDAT